MHVSYFVFNIATNTYTDNPQTARILPLPTEIYWIWHYGERSGLNVILRVLGDTKHWHIN